MENKTRRKIYLVSFFVFAVLAVGLILFTQGYQIDFGAHKLYRAGIVVINSNPEGAEIYLNGKKQNDKTPATLRNLVPGDYTMTIRKDGYLEIEQHLTVDTEKVNYDLENLELFLKESPLNQITSRNTQNFFLSPDQSKVIYATNSDNKNQLWFLDLTKNKLSEIPSPTESISNLKIETWSDTGKQFVLNAGKENYYLGDLTKKVLTKLTNFPAGIKKVEWHPRDKKRLLVLAGEELYLFSLEDPNGSGKLILSDVAGLIREKNDLFGLLYSIKDNTDKSAGQVSKGTTLYKLNGNGEKQSIVAEDLPQGKVIKIAIRNQDSLLPQERQTLILIENNQEQNNLLLIKPKTFSGNSTVTEIDQNVSDFLITSDNQKCIFSKSNELFSYDFEKNQSNLITRLQEKIVQFFLHPVNQDYLYLTTPHQIKAINQKSVLSQTIYDFGEMLVPQINLVDKQNYFLILGRKDKNWGDIFEFYPQGQK